jgi:hypothetical protein
VFRRRLKEIGTSRLDWSDSLCDVLRADPRFQDLVDAAD